MRVFFVLLVLLFWQFLPIYSLLVSALSGLWIMYYSIPLPNATQCMQRSLGVFPAQLQLSQDTLQLLTVSTLGLSYYFLFWSCGKCHIFMPSQYTDSKTMLE